MRNVLTAVLLVALALPLAAQSTDRPTRVSVFLSDFGWTYSEGAGSDMSGGFGVALEYRLRRAWSAEIAIAAEEHSETVTSIGPAGVTLSRIDVRSWPVDATGRYHFLGVRTRWRPYVGAGVRFVPEPEVSGFAYESRLSAQALTGVDYSVNEALSVRFDFKRLLRTDSAIYDNVNKISLGVGWRF
jgi:outer membrane protein W